MKLTDLLERISLGQVYGSINVNVSDISDDSRSVNRGNLFVAIKGDKTDAHKFITKVVEAGANVVVGEIEPKSDWLKKITYIKVENSRFALSLLASAWYGHPSKTLKVIGVTGTKGKTTVCHILYWIL